MPKLRLDLDELQVESFAVTRERPRRRGTIEAHGQPTPTYACTEGYMGCQASLDDYTCHASDNPTECDMTCWEMHCDPSGRMADSCQTEAACASFTMCTIENCD